MLDIDITLAACRLGLYVRMLGAAVHVTVACISGYFRSPGRPDQHVRGHRLTAKQRWAGEHAVQWDISCVIIYVCNVSSAD
jgi:hypothetical protein